MTIGGGQSDEAHERRQRETREQYDQYDRSTPWEDDEDASSRLKPELSQAGWRVESRPAMFQDDGRKYRLTNGHYTFPLFKVVGGDLVTDGTDLVVREVWKNDRPPYRGVFG